MKLRSDTIGHFDSPNEKNIRDAVVYADEGGREGDIVKLMIDEENFISIWVGKRLEGHSLTLKSEAWKLESSERISSEIVEELMIDYLNGNLSKFRQLNWKRPIIKKLLDNIEKLINPAFRS